MPWHIEARAPHDEIMQAFANARPVVDRGERAPAAQVEKAREAVGLLLPEVGTEPYTQTRVAVGGAKTDPEDPASDRLTVVIENVPADDAEAQEVRVAAEARAGE